MTKFLCVHGHFYQPPRFDPWLEEILTEGSAAPAHDWNERITNECYAPLALARRLDHQGHITEMINCYAWISFNLGPTLLAWMEGHDPDTYARILQADQESQKRLGYGNALAQVYHHAIMPLSMDLDKDVEILWAIQDFQARFNRKPDGMWLAETAVDLPTLEALVKHNIGFTILAPRQAKAVRALDEKTFHSVDETTLDSTQPYLVRLPSGQSITVFFYQGEISKAVAFDRLLENGENFWTRLTQAAPQGLSHIATDGESYGHHFMFGEMALAYVIDQARTGRDQVQMTNYAAYLAAHPPTHEVLIYENTSWSCVHGLERWKTHCGCSTGGHPDWMQDWRRPLRRCLNYLKYYVDEHFFKIGKTLFLDPLQALKDYGLVLAQSLTIEDFLDTRLKPGCTKEEQQTACKLLVMQKQALASFASCAWFFDDIARIEPLNALTAARRALDLLQATQGPDIEAGFVRVLSEAHSNMDDDLDGTEIWSKIITPRKPCLMDLGRFVLAQKNNQTPAHYLWPGLHVEVTTQESTYTVQAFWTRTLKLEKEKYNQADLLNHHLSDRLQVELSLDRIYQQEQELLEKSCQKAVLTAQLLPGFTEGQHRPQPTLSLLMPGLIWNWVFSIDNLHPDHLAYIQTWLAENKDLAQSLALYIEAQAMAWAKDLPKNSMPLATLITRCRELTLPIYWWKLQNLVYGRDDYAAMPQLCQTLGLAKK
ncbi:MAG: DUF3536 domain-containing protein [Desulfovibrionales bacterium]|nr:DUF3536 domain-containing protein [Desulfovibrionales bacterium]